MRRANLWALPEDDLYRAASLGVSPPGQESWACRSFEILVRWNIVDWPAWCERGSTLSAYKAYVKKQVMSVCLEQWRGSVSHHVIPLQYLAWRPCPSCELSLDGESDSSWRIMLGQRSLCRLRAGLICFGHSHGARSNARQQACIFCGTLSLSLHFHVLCRCGKWQDARERVWSDIGRAIPERQEAQVLNLFQLGRHDAGYAMLVDWARLLDADSTKYCG